MSDAILIAIIGAVSGLIGALFGAGGVVAWRKAGVERRKVDADTQSQILKDLNEAYVRVCDELAQTQMRLVSCEVENERCRERVQKLQGRVTNCFFFRNPASGLK